MGALPAIAAADSVASLLTLVLAAVASLRAGSRLQRRMMASSDGCGSLGLMDGPPILGPPDFRRRRRREEVEDGANNETLLLADGSGDDGGRGNGTECREEEGDDGADEASPLWEHTEAFRRAVILGLIFDDDDDAHSDGRMFSDVVRSEGESSIDDVVVRGGTGEEDEEEDLAIAAAVEAGLLPSTGNNGDRSAARRGGSRNGSESSSSGGKGKDNNPVAAMASWFVRELSAPLAAIPAWHGILRSYLRQQKKDDESRRRPPWWCLMTHRERLRFLLTGNGGEGGYDPSGLDFGSSISGTARIPRCSDDDADDVSNTVRVRAFAPKTFRDLRNGCFRMSEGDYARSVLNAMGSAVGGGEGGAIFASDGVDGAWGAPPTMEIMADDAARKLSLDGDRWSISHIFREILAGEEGHRRGGIDAIQHRRNGRETPRTTTTTLLPYVSFQSNSKGAARAGTFFFFTADGAYMIKTVKREEAKAFLDMLPEYHRFMSEGVNGRNSLLTRIFGMYSVRFLGEEEAADDDARKRPSADDDAAGGDRWEGGLFSSSAGSRCGDDASSSDLLLEDDERVYLVMHSVFPSDASSFVTERFDLKGSTVGRECSMEERKSRGANAVLKDLDLKREVEAELECMKSDDASPSGRSRGYGLCVGRRRRTALLAQLERDVDLLRRCNVLDYSLLVGVADMETPRDENSPGGGRGRTAPTSLQNFFRWMDFPFPYYGAGTTEVDGGALSRMPGTRRGRQVLYYMGVIDFLQPWTVKKRLERDLKGLAGYDKSAISCVAPADYAARFLEFVESHVT